MRKITADWIVPVSSPPIKNGVLIINDEGKILSIENNRYEFEDAELEIYSGIICPGFINAHCHLELSYMKGKFTEHTGLVNFIFNVLKTRDDNEASVKEAIEKADAEMFDEGIVAVGDISNAETSFQKKTTSQLRYHTFVECFGLGNDSDFYLNKSINVFREASKNDLAASITPHAPYSMSNQLFEKIFSFKENAPSIFSYHNQESEEENKLYRGEKSMIDDFYKEFNLPTTNHRKAESSLKAHLNFFPSEKNVLFVHNTFASRDDVEFAMHQHQNLYWCFCPNANLYIENKLPDFQNFKHYSDRICIGTDSLASNHQLSILEEMKIIQKHDASIATSELVQWATLNGARFFGWQRDLGSIEVGKTPGLNLISTTQSDSLLLSSNSKVKKLC